MLEIIEVLFNATGIIIFICLFIRMLLHLFLTSTDDYSYSYFSYDYQIGFLLIYDKKVEPKYEWIKKLSNFVLVCGVRLFVLEIVLLLIKNLIVHK